MHPKRRTRVPEAPVTLEYVALWNSNLNQTAQVSNMWVVLMAKHQSVIADFGKPRLSVGLAVTPLVSRLSAF